MILLLLLSLVIPQSTAGDGAVVMLPGVPAEPWQSLSDEQKEEMWTFGIEGYQVTRSGWSGYILRGPAGSAPILSELCETLKTDSLVPDSSLWARTLQLVWNTNALAEYMILDGFQREAPVMPVRTSRWIEAGADTLILSLPVENTVFLWGGGYSGDFHLSAWRGIGTEVIPAGQGCVSALVSSAIQGSPEDIINLEYRPENLDSWWGDSWAPLLAAADSLVVDQIPAGIAPAQSLVWIRGTGGARLEPWTMIPSPSPPAVARHTIEPRSGILPMSSTNQLHTGVLEVTFPGNAGSSSRAVYASALLERIIARMALPEGSYCRGDFTVDGQVRLLLTGVDWTEREALEVIGLELLPIIFTAPEQALMNNAAVKAGIPVMDQRETIELLAKVTGFLN